MQEQNINNIPAQMQQGQPQQMPQMPMQPPMPPRGGQRRQSARSAVRGIGRPTALQQERILPNWVVGKSIVFFFIAFIACTVVWGYPMEFELALLSSLSVVLFFYGSKTASQEWAKKKERVFVRNVCVLGLVVRLLWVLYCYFFFNPAHYGTTYGEQADVEWYMPFAKAIAEWIKDENRMPFSELLDVWYSAIDDVGYPFWLAIISIIIPGESDVFVPFVVKCIVSAYCAVCVYHIAERHFGTGTARMAALFVALNPNLIYWCASMFKEAEMVFLCCLCVDLVDKTFSSGKKLTFRSLYPGVLVGFAIFFFRSVLAIVLFLAMFAHIVMASKRVMSNGKKIIAGVLVAATLFIGIGDQLQSQAEQMMESAQSDMQKENMEWMARREGGNSFAKYASATVFAPLIFTIPFPTFNVSLESQILQRQLAGGSYIKNIFSFFVIWVLIMMLISGEWRRHVFIIAYTGGYLVTLVMSEFAQSGRFHMPIWPMLMLFSAYGIQMAKTNPRMKRWFPIVLVVEVFACLIWNWYKLAGRGMV